MVKESEKQFNEDLKNKQKGYVYGQIDKVTGKLVDVRYHDGVSLEMVHQTYQKYYHVEDTKRIDVVLAFALSSKLDGIPLWLILVGPSGDMKSVQLNSLKDFNSFFLHNLTSKTIVNGYRDKSKYPDLAPELDGKVVVIPDMAQILKLPPNEKGELWGQLRDLYDGLAGKMSGQGSRASYSDLKVTLIAGSTPAIDGQILVHQDLGTRELVFRTRGSQKKQKVMKQCFENEEFERKISDEIKGITNKFLQDTEIKRDYIHPTVLEKVMEIATYITYMRASAEFDQYTNELRNDIYPEEPTRISKQLKRLFVCLTSLSKDYPDKRAIEILWHIAKSSAFPIRIKIFDMLLKAKPEISTSEVSNSLLIGKSTAKRELNAMWNMKLVVCKKEPINTMYSDRTYDYWTINDKHPFVKSIKSSIYI